MRNPKPEAYCSRDLMPAEYGYRHDFDDQPGSRGLGEVRGLGGVFLRFRLHGAK